MAKPLLDLINEFATNTLNFTTDIVTDAHKSFIATFLGTSTFTLPSYICNIVGTKTPDIIMTLQTIGLIVTITLGVVSIVKNVWDLIDKICTKFKHKRKTRRQ